MSALSIVVLVVGLILVAAAVFDLFLTALTASRGGPIMGALTRLLWRGFVAVRGVSSARVLRNHAGWIMSLALAALWIGLLWVGWALVFSTSPTAVVDSNSGMPADLAARVYFAGYTISTLGMGDFNPGGPVWQILTAVASITGLLTATMILTYLVPVIGAVAGKRKLAASIAILGESPEAILSMTWNGRDLSALDRHLHQILPMLVDTAQQYSVYPILHFFHAGHRDVSLPLQVASLHEALILQENLPAQSRLPDSTLVPVKRCMDQLLANIDRSGIRLRGVTPPTPRVDRDRLAEEKAPLSALSPSPLSQTDNRRRALLADWVRCDGWRWDGWPWDATRPLVSSGA